MVRQAVRKRFDPAGVPDLHCPGARLLPARHHSRRHGRDRPGALPVQGQERDQHPDLPPAAGARGGAGRRAADVPGADRRLPQFRHAAAGSYGPGAAFRRAGGAGAAGRPAPELEEAALSLGANRLQTFREVTLPLISPAILGGFLFAVAISFDNITATLFWKKPGIETVPTKIFAMLRTSISPEINALGSVMIVLTILLPLIGGYVIRRFSRGR